MKKLLFLLMMLPVVLIAQPGNPDANGVVSPGPPWVTGVSEGDGELKAQFGYLSTRIDSLPGPEYNFTLDKLAVPYMIYGDGLHNETDAIQNAINNAMNGRVIFPAGIFNIDSLRVGYVPGATQTYTPSLYGAGEAYGETIGVNTTALVGQRNKPVITVDVDTLYPFGGTIAHFYIGGPDDSTNNDGIRIYGASQYRIHDNYILGVGGWGIKAETGYTSPLPNNNYPHIHNYNVFENQLQNCGLGGIKAFGRNTGGGQLNAFDIINNHIIGNDGYGIWAFGTTINILENIIEGNDSSGVYISSYGTDAANSARVINIENNHFEVNGGGEIYCETDWDGSYAHTINKMSIERNYFVTNSATLTKPGVIASVTLAREPGSSGTYYYNDVHIGLNSYGGTAGVYVDGRNATDYKTRIYIDQYTTTPLTKYVNIGTAQLYGAINKGRVYSGSLTDGAPTDAEIDAIIGYSYSDVGSGAKYIIKDTNGTGLTYVIIATSVGWSYSSLTVAL